MELKDKGRLKNGMALWNYFKIKMCEIYFTFILFNKMLSNFYFPFQNAYT